MGGLIPLRGISFFGSDSVEFCPFRGQLRGLSGIVGVYSGGDPVQSVLNSRSESLLSHCAFCSCACLHEAPGAPCVGRRWRWIVAASPPLAKLLRQLLGDWGWS